MACHVQCAPISTQRSSLLTNSSAKLVRAFNIYIYMDKEVSLLTSFLLLCGHQNFWIHTHKFGKFEIFRAKLKTLLNKVSLHSTLYLTPFASK